MLKTHHLFNGLALSYVMSRCCNPDAGKGSSKTGQQKFPQKVPLKSEPLGLAWLLACIKGRLCLDRRLDFNSRASQVQCGFTRRDQKAQNPRFSLSRVPIFGGATFSY